MGRFRIIRDDDVIGLGEGCVFGCLVVLFRLGITEGNKKGRTM